MKRTLLIAIGALALAGCRGGPDSIRIDPALAALVPAETVLLAGVKLDALRQTPAWERHLAGRELPFVGNFSKRTGLDLRKEVWELLVASDGRRTVLMARGKFSESGLEPRLSREGARRMPYRGYTLIGDDEAAVLFVNSTTAVAGRPDAIRAVIDGRERSAGPPPALQESIRWIPPRSQVWLAATGGLGELGTGNFGKVLSSFQSLTAAAEFGSGLEAHAAGLCRSEAEAESLADVVRGLLAIARLGGDDAFAVEQRERTVRIEAQLDEAGLERVISTLGEKPGTDGTFPP